MTSGGSYWILPDEKGNRSGREIIEDIFEKEEEQKKRQREKKDKELEQWKTKGAVTSSSKDNKEEEDAAAAYFRAVFFRCVKSNTTIVKNQYTEGTIQAHKESCPWCKEAREERKKEEELRREGPLKLQYILHEIRVAREDIDFAKRKIEKEKTDRLKNWELAIKEIKRREIEPAEYTIKKEVAELDKLLNHENKVIREGAQEEYQKYLKNQRKKEKRKQKE
jgi:hypothetical protein